MLDHPLFVYGTLRDPDLRHALLGRALPLAQLVDATAPGFAAVYVPQQAYPALVSRQQAAAPGLLLHGLTELDLTILDAFEGDEYRRATLPVLSAAGPRDSQAYLPVAPIPLDAAPWTLANWTLLHKPAVLAGERAMAAALRLRLSATRQAD